MSRVQFEIRQKWYHQRLQAHVDQLIEIHKSSSGTTSRQRRQDNKQATILPLLAVRYCQILGIGHAISVNPLQIVKVEQNKKKPDTTCVNVVGNYYFDVKYDYKTTCDMIDDALKA